MFQVGFLGDSQGLAVLVAMLFFIVLYWAYRKDYKAMKKQKEKEVNKG